METAEAAPMDVGGVDTAPSFDSALDSAFADTPEPSTEPEVDAPVAEEAAAPETEAPVDELQEGEVAEPPVDQITDDMDLAALDTTGPGFFQIPKAKLGEVLADKKFADQVRDFAPSIEAAKANYSRSSQFRHMASDFKSGDPNKVGAFLDFWGKESPQSLGVLADRLPQTLAAINPEAATQLQSSVLGSAVDSGYQEAARLAASGDPNAESFLFKVQSLDYAINGKYREQGQLPKFDPNAEREQSIAAREQALQTQHEQQIQNTWKNLDNQQITGGKNNALKAEIDRVIAPVKEKLANAPGIVTSIERNIRAELAEALSKDFEFTRNQQVDYQDLQTAAFHALRTGTKTNLAPAVKAYVDSYQAKVRNIVNQVAKPLIEQASQSIVQQNQAVHAKAKLSASKTEATGGGKPRAKSVGAGPRTIDSILSSLLG